MIRLHSAALNKNIKVDTETGLTYVNDLNQIGNTEERKQYISYTIDELEIIAGNTGEITPQIHLVKLLFGGTIIKYDKEHTE